MDETKPDNGIELFNPEFKFDRDAGDEVDFSWYLDEHLSPEGHIEVDDELTFFWLELLGPDYLRGLPWSLKILDHDFREVLIDLFIERDVYFFGDSLTKKLALWPFSVGHKTETIDEHAVLLAEEEASF